MFVKLISEMGHYLRKRYQLRLKEKKKQETVKFINYTENFADDGSATLESKTDSIQSNSASLEHPLYTTKSAPLTTDVSTKFSLIDPVFVNPASKSSLRVVLDKIAI